MIFLSIIILYLVIVFCFIIGATIYLFTLIVSSCKLGMHQWNTQTWNNPLTISVLMGSPPEGEDGHRICMKCGKKQIHVPDQGMADIPEHWETVE